MHSETSLFLIVITVLVILGRLKSQSSCFGRNHGPCSLNRITDVWGGALRCPFPFSSHTFIHILHFPQQPSPFASKAIQSFPWIKVTDVCLIEVLLGQRNDLSNWAVKEGFDVDLIHKYFVFVITRNALIVVNLKMFYCILPSTLCKCTRTVC